MKKLFWLITLLLTASVARAASNFDVQMATNGAYRIGLATGTSALVEVTNSSQTINVLTTVTKNETHSSTNDLWSQPSGGYGVYVTTGTLSHSGIALGADNNQGKITTNGAATDMVFELNGTQCGIVSATNTGWLIKGTNTNGTPPAGYVGQIISSATAAATSFPSSGSYGDLVAVSLTAGHWMVSAAVGSTANGGTVTFTVVGALSTSGDNPPPSGMCRVDMLPPTAVTDVTSTFSNCEFKLTGTTTVYLKYRANYTVATPKAVGTIVGVRLP